MRSRALSRRDFLHSATLAAAATVAFPAIARAQNGGVAPANRLNLAFVGVGGRGRSGIAEHDGENYVAFCDVDDERAAETYAKHPAVPRFRDYRRMFDKLGREIQAVRISTPDHMHYPVALAALQLGKHVYLEKPLTHTVWEARELGRLAASSKVATQMGNQGHANEGMRLLREWLDAGVLGEVREMHSWTNRPVWPQGVAAPDHSKLMPVVPASLDWDLWLGVAPAREYDPAFAPFAWRGFWDYGCGALGDMACHVMDGAFWALDLGAPLSVEAVSAKATEFSCPTASVVTYRFPARGSLPPLTWTWYDGGFKPTLPLDFEEGRKLPESGTFIMGSKAYAMADTYYGTVRIVPEVRMKELAPSLPRKTLARSPGHAKEWIDACKGGPRPGSHFGYAAPFSETVLLGNVAIRAGRRLEWDAKSMRITNYPGANRLLTKEYRPGFL